MVRSLWLIAVATVCAHAQRTATTVLQVQVQPEAHLAPQQIALKLQVSADGTSEVTSQTETIAAWVRALPGQRIRLQASVASLSGPDGAVAPSALGWSGSLLRATASAQGAACTTGTFDATQAADLISNWTRSASLACSVTFSLLSPGALQPGSYTGTIALTVQSQ